MAWEHMMGQSPWTAAASTGLRQYRFVAMATDGTVGYPAADQPVDGVIRGSEGAGGGTTGTTNSGQRVSIYPTGSIAMVEAEASTLAVGDLVYSSSVGQASTQNTGAYAVGRVVAGSSGAANRVLSVRLDNIGTT